MKRVKKCGSGETSGSAPEGARTSGAIGGDPRLSRSACSSANALFGRDSGAWASACSTTPTKVAGSSRRRSPSGTDSPRSWRAAISAAVDPS